ncbi:PGDYG domain-containing protein [Candidatus Vampirococcus lugosii]|nr:PGDYG domain-containing protein [Candidatus Vampirococcus lugosii]
MSNIDFIDSYDFEEKLNTNNVLNSDFIDKKLELVKNELKENLISIEELIDNLGLKFFPVMKKKLLYNFVKSIEDMPTMSYTIVKDKKNILTIITNTSNGNETINNAKEGDIIISGIRGEKYVIEGNTFSNLYEGEIGSDIYPEQSPRYVAIYTGNKQFHFKAPWGENVLLNPGDYIIKEDVGKYYVIAKEEFEITYN